METKLLNNISETVWEDMKKIIGKKSKISMSASCFSMYAYNALKKQLNAIDEFKFIFTAPTFIEEKKNKSQREFYIPKLNREKSLYGTEFEIKLRNEMTQRAVAKECADWIRKCAKFKSNITGENMIGFVAVESGGEKIVYNPINEFTVAGIGCERGNNAYNMVTRMGTPIADSFFQIFNSLWNDNQKFEDVTEKVVENISTAYNENSPELIYFMMLYNVFKEFLEDISEDFLPNEATGFKKSKIWSMLYDFQRDAVLAIINKLEQYNGCILADSVGLGKTFSALAVIKYYENRNKSVLVLCPKKLSENWNTFKGNYLNNPIAEDRLRYDVLFHTDLSRNRGNSNGIDLARLNWNNYDLVVIDESHNFRNGGDFIGGDEQRENRYLRLMNKVIRTGVKTKVLMLSATPVNNRFYDLRNQLALAYEGTPQNLDEKLNISKSTDEIFRQAQKAFNNWSELPAERRTTDNLLRTLDFDFFELLDSVTIARSRKHIERYYNAEKIGKFPKRLKPVSVRPKLTDLSDAIIYNEIYEQISELSLEIYTPSIFIFESRLEKYTLKSELGPNLTQAGRERGIQRIMRVNLLKRLESSVHSFRLTLQRMLSRISNTLETINNFEKSGKAEIHSSENISDDFDGDDQNTEYFTDWKNIRIDLKDMDYIRWRDSLQKDAAIMKNLLGEVKIITPEHDKKLQTLLNLISKKIENPINAGNKKILIFSAFADTAEYLYEHVSEFVKKNYSLDSALITGTGEGKSTIKKLSGLNDVLTCFSPISKNRDLLMPNSQKNIDVLIATDCISEGQNLQDCDYCINFDIHWNPVRIIQRFGRIDRIGSRNEKIQLVNFWPDLSLDEYINLKVRVETKMKISVMTATGDDNPLSPEEKGDLEYRLQQLKRLQDEVVDFEEMNDGISIVDLGLNEFRLDLLEYIKLNGDLNKKPFGLHAVAAANGNPSGVIFVLKNRDNAVNFDNLNRIHPFYLVYVDNDGKIVCDYLNPKKLLDTMRLICRGADEPIRELYQKFNIETDDGRNMAEMSQLLSDAINSIIDVKEENDIDSLFKKGGTTALLSKISGIDDFELVCFLVVR